MRADTIIYNIGELITPHRSLLHRGDEMSQVEKIHDAYIAIKDGKILDYGEGSFNNYVHENTYFHNALGKVCIPGLIDSHTHLVHGGSRENEFKMKLEGVSYLDILKQGGGILSTVQMTREATFDELYNKAKKSLNEMMLFGVTTIEAKSGYGLNLETELKMLEVMNTLKVTHPMSISTTYLGAHAVPLGVNKEEYVESVLNDLLTIREKNLAESCDVFCENHVFNLEDTKRILERAKELKYHLRLHSDEISSLGGVELAIRLEASSVDHLMVINDEDIKLLGASKTVANILPCTSFYLNQDFAPVRKMIDNGCIIALSSDYNPGSCPSENYQLVMQMAANKLRMTPSEVLVASTINPAYSLGLKEKIGSIAKGKDADVVILDATNFEYALYHFGINHTKDVFKNGKLVVKNREIIV
jgi:imidazolonepropionase